MTCKSMIDISAIHQDVKELLGKDKSGHGMDHIDRVLKLAMTFAEKSCGLCSSNPNAEQVA